MTDEPDGYTYNKETQKIIIEIKFLPSYLSYLCDVYNLTILRLPNEEYRIILKGTFWDHEELNFYICCDI